LFRAMWLVGKIFGTFFSLFYAWPIHFVSRGLLRCVIVKYRVKARIPSSYFDDCFLPLYIYISNTAAGPRNKS
jgi:hypothetical protein